MVKRPLARRLLGAGALAILLPVATLPAELYYHYERGEYVTVNQGASPDGRYAIATRGEGEFGKEHFHVYLMDAKTGHKVGPLTEIKDFLDTGAEAYEARWSADSGQVTIYWRRDRRDPVMIVYRIAHNRAYLITGPETGWYK